MFTGFPVETFHWIFAKPVAAIDALSTDPQSIHTVPESSPKSEIHTSNLERFPVWIAPNNTFRAE